MRYLEVCSKLALLAFVINSPFYQESDITGCANTTVFKSVFVFKLKTIVFVVDEVLRGMSKARLVLLAHVFRRVMSKAVTLGTFVYKRYVQNCHDWLCC
jgi:hypothetical protein